MKYLQDYMTEAQNELFEKQGVFFAFSNEQFKKGCEKIKRKPDERITDFGSGMFGLSKNADEIIAGLDKIYTEAIQKDIEENGLNKIIRRELSNHEAYYTRDLTDTIEKLSDYPVTADEINKVFNNKNYNSFAIDNK